MISKVSGFISSHRKGVALTVILLIAIFFRFWQLATLPPGLFPDEAANGLDVFRIQDGDIRALYNTNGPREALFFYLQAIFVTLLGNTTLALRLAPAIIGTFAVLATYLLAKEWWSYRAGLVAALFMATGPYAVTMSRIGFRASMVPLLLPLTAWLLTKGFKSGKWYYWVLSGLALGAGFYTYISFRMVPFVALAIIALIFIKYREYIRQLIVPALIVGSVTAITLVPLGLYTLKHPGDVLGGRSSVSFTNPELNGGRPLQTLVQNLGKTAIMYNVAGDNNYRHNLGGEPLLSGFVGIMFIFGGLIALSRFLDVRYFALLVTFGAMLVPEILTAEGIPHALRAIGTLPVVYLLAGIGVIELLDRWRSVFPRNPAALAVAMATLLSVVALNSYYDYKRYFVVWANDPETYEAYSEDVVAVADYLNTQSYPGKRYAVIDGFSNITVAYLTHNKTSYTRIDPHELAQVSDSPVQIVVAASLDNAAQINLQGYTVVNSHYSPERSGVLLYKVYERK